MSQLNDGAKTIVKTCMNIQKNEELLIITDESRIEISKAIAKIAFENEVNVTQIILTDEIRPILTVNKLIESALKKSDVVLTPFQSIPEETSFRLSVIRLATKYKSRLGHMPGVDKRMLIEGGLKADYNELMQRSERMLKKFKNQNALHVTSSCGTDLNIKLGKRQWIMDLGLYHQPGVWGNLPAGELFIAPLENGVNGTLVIDGSIGFFGLPKHPIKIHIEEGKLKRIFSQDKQIEEKLYRLIFINSDNNAQSVGEFGIGTNNYAKLTGNLLEDEKVYGTAHLAFGNNIGMGGKNKSNLHIDMIFKNPEFD